MSRHSASSPTSPSSSRRHNETHSHDIYSPIPRHLSIVPSLSNLSISTPDQHGSGSGYRPRNISSTSSSSSLHREILSRAEGGSSSRGSMDYSPMRIGKNVPGRPYTATPSSTSISSDEDDYGDNDRTTNSVRINQINEAKSWLDMDSTNEDIEDGSGNRKGKGKGKYKEADRPEGLAGRLPPEILIQILRLLPDTQDLLSALLVSRTWCLCTFSLIWTKPQITNINTLASLIRVISNDNNTRSGSSNDRLTTTLPYANTIRRLHLNQVTNYLTDELFMGLRNCTKLERLTLSNAINSKSDSSSSSNSNPNVNTNLLLDEGEGPTPKVNLSLSTRTLIHVISNFKNLLSFDSSGIQTPNLNDSVIIELSKNCHNLQAINLTECKYVGDEGVLALSRYCKSLKRAKFSKCHRITPKSLIPLILNCPHLIELDLQDVISTTDSVVYSIFTNCHYLRELKLNNCTELTQDCIPNLIELKSYSDDQLSQEFNRLDFNNNTNNDVNDNATLDLNWMIPKLDYLDQFRLIDLTGCSNIGDKAIENLIHNAPKLRTLTLSKCSNLTDKTLEYIESLGKHLHYLHLGHVNLITDAGLIRLAKTCTRLRYIDLACCDLLTDKSIRELGPNMPKLRRVGLVKVLNITDESLYAFVEKYTVLERVHLSYCDKLSVKGISHMLNRLPHLRHISLTGVSSFKKKELQRYCRPPPNNFNQHQRDTFCVFSNHLVDELRRYLNEVYLVIYAGIEESDSTSTRRNSASSSTSSLTLPGTSSPPFILPHHHHHYNQSTNPAWVNSPPPAAGQSQFDNSASNGYVYRRGSAPTLRNNQNIYSYGGRQTQDITPVPGLPSIAFVNPTPNFLTPPEITPIRSGTHRSSHSSRTHGHGHGTGSSGVPSRIREANTGGGIAMSSREGSASSLDNRERERNHRSTASHTSSHTGQRERERPSGPREREVPSNSNRHHHQHQYRSSGSTRTHQEDNEVDRQYGMPGGFRETQPSTSVSPQNSSSSRRRSDIQYPTSSNSNSSGLGMRWFGWSNEENQ